jgi:PAS domain S-box-containing protein
MPVKDKKPKKTKEELQNEVSSLERKLQSYEKIQFGMKNFNEQVIERSESLNIFLNSLNFPFYVIDPEDYTVKFGNLASGIKESDIGKIRCFEISHNRDTPCEENERPCPLMTIKSTGQPAKTEHVHFNNLCQECLVEVHVIPVFDRDQKLSRIIHYEFNISSKKNMEILLNQSEEKFQRLSDFASDAIVMLNGGNLITYWNKSAEGLFGYSREEAIGKSFTQLIISGKQQELFLNMLQEFNKSGIRVEESKIELEACNKENCLIDIEFSPSMFNFQEEHYIMGIIRNISQRKRQEEENKKYQEKLEFEVAQRTADLEKSNRELRESIQEKEILLREVHHRARNNMQIISSLLSLQTAEIDDPNVRNLCENSKKRIQAMSLVHENLYKSDNFSKVNFGEYVGKLSRSIIDVASMGKVELDIRIKDIFLDLNTTIYMGLIINELITNSLKHAFQNQFGIVQIYSKPTDKGVELIYQDSGPGLPLDFDLSKAETLGMKLIHILVSQIQGRLELSREQGMRVSICF